MSRSRERDDHVHKAARVPAPPCNTAASSLECSLPMDPQYIVEDKEVLSPQKVAQQLSKTGPAGDACPVMMLPDSVLLSIMGYLTVRELCRAACVCRRWNHLVRQKPLWRHVDLTPFRITLVDIRKLVFAYFSGSLRRLQLTGFLRSIKKTECISDSLLVEVGKRSPNLEDLSICEANLASVNSSNLPSGLKALKLLKCNYPTFWLSDAHKIGRLDSLQCLDMSGSNGFGVRDVECVTPEPLLSLVTLRLSGCYRVGPRGAGRIADRCPNLQELDLTGVPLSNHTLQQIGSGLPQLRILHLSQCCNTDGVLFDVHHLAPLKRLEQLHITDNTQFSGDVLVGLVNCLPSLKLLKASKNDNLTEDHVSRMKNTCALPPGDGNENAVWRLGFYPQDKLQRLAAQQCD